MSRFSTHVPTVCAFLVTMLTVPCTGAADPIKLSPLSGMISVGPSSASPVNVDIGGAGFSFVAFADNAIFDPNCSPCQIGLTATPIGFSAALIGPFTGRLTYQDRTFALGRGSDKSDDMGSLSVSVTVPFVIGPSPSNETVALTRPFSFGGSLTVDLDRVAGTKLEFEFAGNGISTGSFDVIVDDAPPGQRLLDFAGATFDFNAAPAPVPEPATLVLLATGLGGWLIRTTCQRRQ